MIKMGKGSSRRIENFRIVQKNWDEINWGIKEEKEEYKFSVSLPPNYRVELDSEYYSYNFYDDKGELILQSPIDNDSTRTIILDYFNKTKVKMCQKCECNIDELGLCGCENIKL